MTDIQDVVQTVDPFSVQVFNDTMLQVSSRFDNSQVTGAYFIQTIGLFARLGDGDPVLFEVAQAITPDEMPAQSAVAPSAFVYNMQVTIQQASQLTVTVNPAGTATVQDILTLNATKVDIDGGDISNTIAATFEASNASWPIPAAGETIKVILGKIKKHLEDLASWRPTVSLISDIVNNLTSTATNKPLAANQGRVLKESVDQLNSDFNIKTYYALSQIGVNNNNSIQEICWAMEDHSEMFLSAPSDLTAVWGNQLPGKPGILHIYRNDVTSCQIEYSPTYTGTFYRTAYREGQTPALRPWTEFTGTSI